MSDRQDRESGAAALVLELHPERLAVARLAPDAPVPAWASEAPFFSLTRTEEELSLTVPEGHVPASVRAQRGFRRLSVRGPLDFALVGILAGIARALADARVSIFVVSTHDTDHVLVPDADVHAAAAALRAAGHRVVEAG